MSDDALTLPGDIPGLLRRGSPVFVECPDSDRIVRAIAFSIGDTEASVVITEGPVAGISYGYRLSEIALDLTDATGRAHAAWWLKASGFPVPARVSVETYPRSKAMGLVVACPDSNRGGWLGCQPEELERRRIRVGVHALPSLADLDPDDPRTLPDGSRWVDAEALRRVVLHVAGRADG